ncbi:uncharacterized protein LOC110220455 [Phascolarctos cinereus]
MESSDYAVPGAPDVALPGAAPALWHSQKPLRPLESAVLQTRLCGLQGRSAGPRGPTLRAHGLGARELVQVCRAREAWQASTFFFPDARTPGTQRSSRLKGLHV